MKSIEKTLKFESAMNKCHKLMDSGIDWFIKGLKYKQGTDEWMICRLKSRIYYNQAEKYRKIALMYIHDFFEYYG